MDWIQELTQKESITIRTKHGDYQKYGSLTDELKSLAPYGFIRCRQNCLVSYKVRKDALIAYLEDLPLSYDSSVDSEISFCNYLDIWLAGRKFKIKNSTFEVYTFCINAIKRYFETKHYKLLDITPEILDTYFKYFLRYGKVDQKTKELEPLSVR